jgi:DNA-binding GntR family transcriptional regulator
LLRLDNWGLVALVRFKDALVANFSRKAAEKLDGFRSLLGGCADRLAAIHLTHDALS